MSDSGQGEKKEDETFATEGTTEEEETDSLISMDQVRDFLVAQQQSSLLRRALQSSECRCSYPDGYKTQSLLSCLTCSRRLQQLNPTAPPQYVAVCIACVMHCHDEHEVEDVNSKRGMRCDCPTLAARNPQHAAAADASAASAASPQLLPSCKLNPASASPPNSHNVYGQNFAGLYCRCSSAFDPETETSDMYQCLMCEDWFHERCIDTEHNAPEDTDAFLCSACIAKQEWAFLVPYWAAARAPAAAGDDAKDAAVLESKEAAAVAEREERKEAAEAVVDLFPEVSARQSREKEERLLRLQNGAVIAGAAQKQKADAVPGWSCAHCGFFNQPQEEMCFGCEQVKATKDGERGSAALSATAPISAPPAASLPLPSSAPGQQAEGDDDVCRRLTTVPASFPLNPPRDQWLLATWLDEACFCPHCLPLFQAHAPFLLQPDDDLREDGDDGEPLSLPTTSTVSDAASAIVSKYLSAQPRARVLDSIADMQDWTDGMVAGLQAATDRAAAGGAALITAEMVRAIADELLDGMKRKRRRQTGDDEEERGREGQGGGRGGGDDADGSKRGRFEE